MKVHYVIEKIKDRPPYGWDHKSKCPCPVCEINYRTRFLSSLSDLQQWHTDLELLLERLSNIEQKIIIEDTKHIDDLIMKTKEVLKRIAEIIKVKLEWSR